MARQAWSARGLLPPKIERPECIVMESASAQSRTDFNPFPNGECCPRFEA